MPSFAGLRGTGDWGTDERPKNFREAILWADPNGGTPLTALLSKMASQSVNDPEFAWFEESLTAVRIQNNTTTQAAAGDNTLTLSSAGGGLALKAGDLLQVEKAEGTAYDNEILMVSSVTNDTTIVVKRGSSGSVAAAIPVNAYMTLIGSSYEEGTGAPTKTTRNPTKKYNYTQIFKTAVGITRTADDTKLRTGDSFKNDKKRKAFDHAVGMEFAFLYGRRYEDLTGGKPRRTTGGLRSFISTNVTAFTTTPTVDTLLDAMYKVFDYNAAGAGNERIILCGNGFLNSFNKLARDHGSTRITHQGTIKIFGMELDKWVIPQGKFALKTHPLMNLHGRYQNSAFIINPAGLKYRYLLDTKFRDNTQANDADSHEGLWITEAGLEVHHEETMAYLTNVTIP